MNSLVNTAVRAVVRDSVDSGRVDIRVQHEILADSNVSRMFSQLRTDLITGYGILKSRGFQMLQRFFFAGILLILCYGVSLINDQVTSMWLGRLILRPILFFIFLQLSLITAVVLYESAVLFFGLNWQTLPIFMRTLTQELLALAEQRTEEVRMRVRSRSGQGQAKSSSASLPDMAADPSFDVDVDETDDTESDYRTSPEQRVRSIRHRKTNSGDLTVSIPRLPSRNRSQSQPDESVRRVASAVTMMSPTHRLNSDDFDAIKSMSNAPFISFIEAQSEHVFFISNVADLIELRRTASHGWRPYNLSQSLRLPPLLPSAGPSTAILATHGSEIWVAVVDNEGVVRLLVANSSMKWRAQAVTELKKPVRPDFPPVLTQTSSMQLQLTVVSLEGTIFALVRTAAGGWEPSSMTEAVNSKESKPAKPLFAPSVLLGLAQQHICYVGPSGSIHEFQHLALLGWSYKLLGDGAATSVSRKALGKAASPLAGFSVYQAGQLYFYATSKGEIMLLSNANPIGGWRVDNLTSTSRAPRCVGNPAVVGNSERDRYYIVHVTPDGGIAMLYRIPGEKIWCYEDVSELCGVYYQGTKGSRRRRINKILPGRELSACIVGDIMFITFCTDEGQVSLLRGDVEKHDWAAAEMSSVLRNADELEHRRVAIPPALADARELLTSIQVDEESEDAVEPDFCSVTPGSEINDGIIEVVEVPSERECRSDSGSV
ncbi:hypothetical protein J8273_1455 [Carpediemonas membranifera]|uniref:Uncharacterized protein n=1 Tax=Carpediemonas membranifera TaxID=201153 RepID=A0A8J6E1K5_9EUKA|nr:hypothetical protein J8273_1455 [Carpediemonas membranifera]|eukprot:KAG9396474.1 hypothetical protein J8273_1455 [Carpediemonas membranifera]